MTYKYLLKYDTILTKIGEITLPDVIHAQYNPDRFAEWERHCACLNMDKLNMEYSPHVSCLRGGNDYELLQMSYGHNAQYASNREVKLFHLRDSIAKKGVCERPMLLEAPRVKNRFNAGMEIYEGHHRIACCIALGIKCICNVYRWDGI